MDKIKAAEAAIKALKDYIEIEKASKEILIMDPEETLDEIQELREEIIRQCCENLEIIKKGE